MDSLKDKNILILIDKEGKIATVEREKGSRYSNHFGAFGRLQEQIPGLLDGFDVNTQMSGGYQLSSLVAAKGNIIIWPSDVNSPDYMIVTLPNKVTDEAARTLLPVLETIGDAEISVVTARFRKRNSPKVITDTLAHGLTSYKEVTDVVEEYIESSNSDNLGPKER